jgi:serine/threonine protein kinase
MQSPEDESPGVEDNPAASAPAKEPSFTELQAQLRGLAGDSAAAQAGADAADHTSRDHNAPKNRGVPPSDYQGPSFSELRRRAAADPNGPDRLALPVDYRLHEYRIEKILGVGGFGASYLAHDTNLNAKVAIKEYLPNELAARNEETAVVYPRRASDSESFNTGLDRFLLEARTLAAFRHHNIVRVSRFFEANGTAYMVMEYERGESFNAWMKKRRQDGEPTLDEVKLIAMMVPLLDGLEKIHAAGFLHRDIKPANIYMRHEDGSLVLLDFGAARQAIGGAQQGMTAIVTPGYAPFEQYHTHGVQGPWSDLYAVGGVLYWCVVGEKPVEAAARIQSDPQAKAVDAAKGRYSESFLRAIDWALEPRAEQRPQSIREFLSEFSKTADPSVRTAGASGKGGGVNLSLTGQFDPATHMPEPELAELERKRLDELGAIGAAELRDKGYYASIARGKPGRLPKAPEATTILVVEDDAGTADVIQRVLQKLGYLTRAAKDRAELLGELGRKPPVDLILLDVMLPKMNGFDVLNRIRQHGALQDIPVIMLTSLNERSDIVKGLALGADGYLTKPARPSALADAVRAALAGG